MSEKKPKDSAPTDADKLFFELLPEIPIALRRACRKLSYSPDPAAFDGLVQQIIFLLLEKDSHRLRSFDHRASAKTWLDRVVRNYLGTHLGKLRRESSLEELPPDSFLSLPDQEEKLLALERKRLLRKAIQKLTSREQMLFQLLCDEGLTMTAVAKNLRVKPATAYRYKHDLIKKLYLLIKVSGGGGENRRDIIKNIYFQTPRIFRLTSLYDRAEEQYVKWLKHFMIEKMNEHKYRDRLRFKVLHIMLGCCSSICIPERK